jgi:ectoine hydroxylase-related dioxygenase (phytanoyl-CoA dioxygenase family)
MSLQQRVSDEPSGVVAGPWLDWPDAVSRNEASAAPEEFKRIASALIADGVAIVRDAIPGDLCDQAIADFADYCAEDPTRVHYDTLNRETRVVNFHRRSDPAMRIGTNPELMRLLDYLFGMEACLYTSLTFKYGTQQPIHRDTPHFGTWPQGYFFGMWVALEDVRDDAGPLMYHRGGHRFAINQRAMYERLELENPHLGPEEIADLALHVFGDEVTSKSLELTGPPELLPVRKGDVVIWHPELPHGGSLSKDPTKTRWSIVYHMAPVAVQVHQHQTFFRHRGNEGPAPRYGYTDAYGRKVAAAGDTGFQGAAKPRPK